MKTKFKTAMLAMSLFVCFSPRAGLAGNEGSGGGDIKRPEYGSAWYLGPKEIRYCYVAAPEFGVANSVLESTMETAFSTWQEYLKRNSISAHEPITQQLILNRQLMRQCDGSEDLKFYFGVSDSKTQRIRSDLYTHPTAFSHRDSYDVPTGWGRGFIWVALPGSVPPYLNFPDWQKPNHLIAQLLHELGHVLGCEHVDGTIMDGEIAIKLLAPRFPPVQSSRLTRIDGSRALYICKKCVLDLPGDFAELSEPSQRAATFKTFVGRAPKGNIVARLELRLEPLEPTLVISDSVGSVRLPVQDMSHTPEGGKSSPLLAVASYDLMITLFKRAYLSGQGYTSSHVWGGVVLGLIKAADGSTRVSTLEVNMDGILAAPVTLRYITADGVQAELFSAKEI